MSKEVKRYEAMLLEDNPRLQNLLPQGAILCGKKPVEVYLATDYEALLAERDAMAKDAERYRWLRNSERMIGEYADDHEHNICVSSADGEDVLWFDQLDTAIDVAMAGGRDE